MNNKSSSLKKSVFASLLLAAAFSAAAADFGGSFLNTSKFADQTASDGLKLDQKNSLSLWYRTPFGDSTTNYFMIQGKYQFEDNFGTETVTNAVDIETAKAVYVEEELTLTAGRFFESDLSGLVYSQAGDGVSLEFSIPAFYAKAYGFYTGLLNSQFTTIIDPDYTADSDSIYDLAPKYAVTGLKASLPAFLGEQSVSAEVLFTTKLDSTTFTRAYAEGALFGPLFFDGLYYNLTGVIGYSKYDDSDLEIANLSKGSIYYYPKLPGTSVSFNSVYVSGEQGAFKSFTGFTSQTAVNSLVEPQYSGIFKNGIGASVKPLTNLLVTAGADLIISCQEDFDYTGFQYNAGVDWQIVSDVYAGAELTQYFDSDDSDLNKTAITIKAAITF